jgi:hypothetical protein
VEPEKVILVYNADSGWGNALLDAVHKAVSPGTYACHLCAVSYGPLTMRRAWRDYLAALRVPVECLHRDAFHARYGHLSLPLPTILRQRSDGPLEVALSAAEIKSLRSVDELMRALSAKLLREPLIATPAPRRNAGAATDNS